MRSAAIVLMALIAFSPAWGAPIAVGLALLTDGYAGPFWGWCWLAFMPAYLLGTALEKTKP